MPPSCLLLAAGGVTPLIHDIGVCLLAGAVVAVLFERLRLPAVAAFLAAGLLIGPVGASLVTDTDNIRTIANLGLVFLLFLIGLELDLHALRAVGRPLVVSGLLQVPLCAIAAFGLFVALRMLGVPLPEGPYVPLYLGFAAAFSSTLLVVGLLQARFQMDTLSGRIMVGLLIFQDVWAIVVLAVQPSFASPSVGRVAGTLLGVLLLIGIAAALARWVLPPAFRLVARVPELVVTAALGWCFGLGLLGVHLGELAHKVGIGLDLSVSLEMGAFIAGTSMATFPYAYDVGSKVRNLRDFFVTLFLLGLGMIIPLPRGPLVLLLALLLAGVAVLLRYLVFLPLLHGSGLDRLTAFDSATKLAQISEFCLVIAYLGLGLGHIGEETVSVVLFAFVLTALLTPSLFSRSAALHSVLSPLLDRLGFRAHAADRAAQPSHASTRLVLLGFHRLGSSLLHEIGRRHPELLPDVLVVDFNVAHHARIAATGARVAYGDLSTPEALRHLGVDQAEVIVSTVPDDVLRGISNQQLTAAMRALAPRATIIANAIRLDQVEVLRRAGADHVFLWRIETARGVVPAVYAALNGELGRWAEARRQEEGDPAERREALD